jgi:uncharacterized membrane protein YphA (DoxX/SURF4 family)
MFSTFPDGWPGAGLLLLRAAGGAVLITQGAAYFSDTRELGFLVSVVVPVMIAVGVLLLIGLLTRFVALLAAVVGVSSVFSWFPRSSAGPLETPMTAVLSAVIAVALICLGAGALSLDARLFGRREIFIPTTSAKNVVHR